MEFEVRDGVGDGKNKVFYRNQNLKIENILENGKINGIEKEYSEAWNLNL